MKLEDLSPVTVILRGVPYETVRTVCSALKTSKAIKNVEITMNTEGCLDCIRKISEEFKDDLFIGAGTVTTYDEAVAAIDAGAQFLLAPVVLSKEINDYAHSKGVLTVSGALSPTEIWQASKNGADVVKVFPITAICDSYFKDVRAPLGAIPFMAVGGVKKTNAKKLMEQGAEYLGMGGLFSKEVLKNNQLDEMIQVCCEFESDVLGI